MRALIGALLLVACGEPGPDAAIDAGRDATTDAGPDAVIDAGRDVTFEPPRCPAPVASQLELASLESHLAALAEIGQENGDRSVAGLGFHASVDYVERQLRELGLDPQRQAFEHPIVVQSTPPELVLLTGGEETALAPPTFAASFRSASGSADGAPFPVGHEASGCGGCDAASWTDFPEGAIAWVRGRTSDLPTIGFQASLSGAAAVLLEVDTGDPERRWDPRGPISAGLPIVLIGQNVAEQVAAADAVRLTVAVDEDHRVSSVNVLAELPGREPGPVLMIGSHLDSVVGSYGVNDNGTGIAVVLELTRALAGCDLRPTVRVAFWGAEEWGLRGSAHYVDRVDPGDVLAYLNLDMLGSPNGGHYVYGEREPGTLAARLGEAFDALGAPWLWDERLGARSDHAAFDAAGVPVVSLVSGAEAIVDDDTAAIFGTEAGLQHDPCYHRSCDDLANVDRDRMLTAARAMAELAEALATER